MNFSFWVFVARQTAEVVAGDEEAQKGKEFGEMPRKAAASAIEGRPITAQVGIGAFDGIGLLFAGQNIVKGDFFARSVDQFAVGAESIAEELSDALNQSKTGVYQRLHGFVSALSNHIEGHKRAGFSVDDGG